MVIYFESEMSLSNINCSFDYFEDTCITEHTYKLHIVCMEKNPVVFRFLVDFFFCIKSSIIIDKTLVLCVFMYVFPCTTIFPHVLDVKKTLK